MGTVEGRGLRKPTLYATFRGAELVLRIDDERNPVTWVTVAFTPEQFGDLFDRFADHLHANGLRPELAALMEKR